MINPSYSRMGILWKRFYSGLFNPKASEEISEIILMRITQTTTEVLGSLLLVCSCTVGIFLIGEGKGTGILISYAFTKHFSEVIFSDFLCEVT